MLFGIDLKARLKNKTFWVSMVSAIAILSQQLGLDIIPSNYEEIINTVLTLLTMLGILVDTSTVGISDKIITNSTGTIESSSSTENETINK